jgi:predicted DsbA family dithiol-disulfide isomerase
MKIEFVSDVACPWCAVGLHSLEKALARIGEEIGPIELEFQPFELNPEMPSEGADTIEYLGAKYGIDEAQIRANQAAIRERGAAVGFTFGERRRVWNTFAAHRLLWWAAQEGRPGQPRALKHALLQAYHGEGRNPGAPDVLLDAAAAVGLDPARASQVLASDEFIPEVRAAEVLWLKSGIDAVPAVVIDRRQLIQGAQTPEVFETALRQIAALAAERA